MTDKERILTLLVKHIYMDALYAPEKVRYWREQQPPFMSINVGRKLEEGDLVIAFTTIEPNDFMVGFVHTPPDENGTVVIREIGSDRLCNYGNETFMWVDKEMLGEEILEGLQYETMRKVRKAFAKAAYPYTLRYAGVTFTDHFCLAKGREVFSDKILVSFSFPYNSKTSIKSIVKRINEEYGNYLKEKENNV